METNGARYEKNKRGFNMYTTDDKKKALAIIMAHEVKRNGILDAERKMSIPAPTLWHWANAAVKRRKRVTRRQEATAEPQQTFTFTETARRESQSTDNDLLMKLDVACRKLEAAERAKKDLTELLILAVKMFNQDKE